MPLGVKMELNRQLMDGSAFSLGEGGEDEWKEFANEEGNTF